MVADGINHAVPTQKELQTSIAWLMNHDFIKKSGNKFQLTEKGKFEYERASLGTKTLFKIRENLELEMKNMTNKK